MDRRKKQFQLLNFYIKNCVCCKAELDIEDFFVNNICEYCGASQNYDKEDFEVIEVIERW